MSPHRTRVARAKVHAVGAHPHLFADHRQHGLDALLHDIEQDPPLAPQWRRGKASVLTLSFKTPVHGPHSSMDDGKPNAPWHQKRAHVPFHRHTD